ncbi:hypothetical protein KXW02_007560, partial [Aspergillus fumigatus]
RRRQEASVLLRVEGRPPHQGEVRHARIHHRVQRAHSEQEDRVRRHGLRAHRRVQSVVRVPSAQRQDEERLPPLHRPHRARVRHDADCGRRTEGRAWRLQDLARWVRRQASQGRLCVDRARPHLLRRQGSRTHQRQSLRARRPSLRGRGSPRQDMVRSAARAHDRESPGADRRRAHARDLDRPAGGRSDPPALVGLRRNLHQAHAAQDHTPRQ